MTLKGFFLALLHFKFLEDVSGGNWNVAFLLYKCKNDEIISKNIKKYLIYT